MKKLLLGVMLLPLLSVGQTEMDKENGVAFNVALGAGYMNHHTKPEAKFSIGAMYKENHLAVNLDMFLTNLRSYPVIPSLTYGRNSKSWEVYGGISYHAYSNDYVNPNSGYYPIFGILHKFPNTALTIDASFTNNIYSLKIGIGGVR